MVIRPNEILRPEKDDEAEIALCEHKIDAALRRDVRYRGGTICLSTDLFGSDRVISEALIKKYRNAGWCVEYQSDQRDGDYYVFKPSSSQ